MGMGLGLKIGAIAAVVLAVALFIWLAFRNVRKRGAAEAKQKYAEKSSERAQDAQRIDDDVRRLSDDDLADELRDTGRE